MKNIKLTVFWALFFAMVLLMPGILYAQTFDIQSLERLKQEFSSFTMPTQNQNNTSNTVKSGEDLLKTTVPNVTADTSVKSIRFPAASEVMAKTNVAHINPDTYVLGSGDVLSVQLYGLVTQNHKVGVQPDGTIMIVPIPPVYVKGLTLSQARNKLFRVLQRYYKGFKVEVQLLELRTFKVEILGEVSNPGTYVANPLVGVCDAIGLAGGIKDSASLRNVYLRDSLKKKQWRVDLFAWYYLGIKSQNRLLSEKQSIFVPLMKDRVSVEGSFKRTGDFEITPGEKVGSILKIVEPDTGVVLTEGKITRIDGPEKLKVMSVDFNTVLENPDDPINITLQDGDKIFAPNVTVFLKKITVIGELKAATLFSKTVNRLTGREEILKIGHYDLKDGETVKDLVINLGGVSAQADMEKARVERPIGDGRVKVIPVDLRKLLYEHDVNQNVALMAGDSFIVPAQATNIYILGEIRAPGAYQYNVGNKIKEYITLAGGPTRRARLKHVKVISQVGDEIIARTIDLRSILTGNLKETFELRPGDVIYLPYEEVISYRDIVGILTDLIVLNQLLKK